MKKLVLAIALIAVTILPATAQSKGLSYPEFKQRFQVGALQHRVPFTLADSLIQEGKTAASMQVFFTSDTDMMIYMEPKTHEIREITVTVSGKKSNGVFNDLGYALAVLWALENYETTSNSEKLMKALFDLPVGSKMARDSGFRYSHPQGSDQTISFTAINTKLVK